MPCPQKPQPQQETGAENFRLKFIMKLGPTLHERIKPTIAKTDKLFLLRRKTI